MALKRIIEDDTVLLQEGGSTILAIQEIVENKKVLVNLTGDLRSGHGSKLAFHANQNIKLRFVQLHNASRSFLCGQGNFLSDLRQPS